MLLLLTRRWGARDCMCNTYTQQAPTNVSHKTKTNKTNHTITLPIAILSTLNSKNGAVAHCALPHYCHPFYAAYTLRNAIPLQQSLAPVAFRVSHGHGADPLVSCRHWCVTTSRGNRASTCHPFMLFPTFLPGAASERFLIGDKCAAVGVGVFGPTGTSAVICSTFFAALVIDWVRTHVQVLVTRHYYQLFSMCLFLLLF